MLKKCNNCDSTNIEYRMFDIDGQNLVEDFTCLDCHGYYTGYSPTIEYEYLSQEQIKLITKYYKNQSEMEDIHHFFYEVEDDVQIETSLIIKVFDDGKSDLIIYGAGDNKKFFEDFDKGKQFSLSLENALEIIENILAWIESTKACKYFVYINFDDGEHNILQVLDEEDLLHTIRIAFRARDIEEIDCIIKQVQQGLEKDAYYAGKDFGLANHKFYIQKR